MFAHSSMVIPFQCLGTWERGREIVVYLGWEMAGLGNRTLCHSLCHSVCDPDLFPAFLTPPLSWGKWCSSCNPHSILTKSWDTVLKKRKSCLEGQLYILHNWFSTCLSGFALSYVFSGALAFSPVVVDLLSGYIMHNFVPLYPFSLSATSVSLHFLSEVETQFFSSASLFFLPQKSHLFSLYMSSACNFLLLYL